ncbi:hypothetical protein [Sporisorium scitamineum]|uniref:Uncharacterized protein n=1 Tax=Sporisorium scitamineum TaxID=49012 RepID=A0A0F7S5N4_9BASI|nr:hypothetical protein [Sporisorium scitamineum]
MILNTAKQQTATSASVQGHIACSLASVCAQYLGYCSRAMSVA